MGKKPKSGTGPMLVRKAAANAARPKAVRVKLQLGPTPSAPGSRLKVAPKPKGKG